MNYIIDNIVSLKGYDKDGKEIINFQHPKMNEITTSYDTKEVKGKYNETLMSFETNKTLNVDFSCSDIILTHYEDECPDIDVASLADYTGGISSDEAVDTLNSLAAAMSDTNYTITSVNDSIRELTQKIAEIGENKNKSVLTESTMEEITEKPNQKSDLEIFEPILPKYEFIDFDDMDFDFKI